MNDNVLHTILLAMAFLALFGSAELFYYRLKLKAEITRKYVHVFTGVFTMLFPLLLGSHWFVLILCASFLLILITSLKFNLLKSINGVERTTRGSLLYPIIVYGCFLMYLRFDQFSFYYLPILILALCDPVAALVGKSWPYGKFRTFGNTKTITGSLGFFVAATLVSLLLLINLEQLHFIKAIVVSFAVALVTTIAEAVSHKGYDNLTIPLGTILVLLLFSNGYF